ncbi:MAG: response regulator, partial [Treponema sp.]|nr:response regulator [Treponema sp.]
MKNGKKNSILIVDDERDNISSLKSILSPDYIIYASINGKEAVETVQEFMPDIILLDVLMPEMDGYDVITALRNSEKMKDIPVIFITGLDDSASEIKGLALGAVDYIAKPFHPAIVRLRVQNQLQLILRLRQQALVTRIAYNFLINTSSDTLYTDTLRMVGEFIDVSTILLYILEPGKNVIVCRNEWVNSDIKIDSRIGDRVKLDDRIISDVNNLLSGNEKDICLNSSSPIFRDFISLDRPYISNYIAAPIFIKGKMNAILVFSREDDEPDWNESETGLAVLVASIFSGVFERNAIKQAEYISRAKSEFLSRMSHEMRTPLNAILGILQIFDIMGIPDNIRENCNVMKDEAHILLRLIENVLDVSDMEYGAFKLSEKNFNFFSMIKEVLKETEKSVSKKNQKFDCNIDPLIPPALKGDEKRLKQVIGTLLDNAIKFTPNNGEIFLNICVTDDENGIITLQVKITDNGIGIAKDQQDNIFSLFEQADTGLTRKYSGIGIGLAFSKHIIEMMDGNIRVESELGHG